MQVTYFSNLPARVDHLVRLLETQPLQLRQVRGVVVSLCINMGVYISVYHSISSLSIPMTLHRTRTYTQPTTYLIVGVPGGPAAGALARRAPARAQGTEINHDYTYAEMYRVFIRMGLTLSPNTTQPKAGPAIPPVAGAQGQGRRRRGHLGERPDAGDVRGAFGGGEEAAGRPAEAHLRERGRLLPDRAGALGVGGFPKVEPNHNHSLPQK